MAGRKQSLTDKTKLKSSTTTGKIRKPKALPAKKRARSSTGTAPEESVNILPVTSVKNPLEIDLVLKEITSYLGNSDLKNCRLVNHQFKAHADAALRKTHVPVELGNTKVVRKFAKYQKEFARQGQRPIFSKFVLKTKITRTMGRKIREFGSQMTRLTIDVDAPQIRFSVPNVINFENVMEILQGTPNLEVLKLNGASFPNPRGEIIDAQVAPVLRHLRSISIGSKLGNMQAVAFSLIDQARCQNITRALLRISPVLTSYSLDLRLSYVFGLAANIETFKSWFYLSLIDYRPGLTELKLLSSNDAPGREHDLVYAHSTTLESLEIRLPASLIVPGNHNPLLQRLFPYLPKLKTLSLYLPCTPYIDPYPMTLIPSLNPFPVLETLSLTDNLLQVYFPPTGCYPSVQEINISYDGVYNGEPEYTRRVNLFKVFPGIKKLVVQVSGGTSNKLNKSLRAMFKSAKNRGGSVTSLTIKVVETSLFGTAYIYKLDELLTGIPAPIWFLEFSAQAYQDIKTPSTDLLKCALRVSEPSLVNFKSLECLEINGTAFEKINDAVAFLSVYTLPPLKMLTLNHSNLSNYYKEILSEYHRNCIFN